MAIREVRIMGDPILAKECRTVEKMTDRLQVLIDDMIETMNDQNGVGLAAPQVGVLRRIAVVDIGDENGTIIMINPEIIESDGEQCGPEGCLSLPGKQGEVKRPNHVVVSALDREMKPITIEGTELLARALCHEIDHLSGHMYTELVEGPLTDVEYADDDEEEQE
jgi:peptide deformylase